jgi:hypothetical protein
VYPTGCPSRCIEVRSCRIQCPLICVERKQLAFSIWFFVRRDCDAGNIRGTCCKLSTVGTNAALAPSSAMIPHDAVQGEPASPPCRMPRLPVCVAVASQGGQSESVPTIFLVQVAVGTARKARLCPPYDSAWRHAGNRFRAFGRMSNSISRLCRMSRQFRRWPPARSASRGCFLPDGQISSDLRNSYVKPKIYENQKYFAFPEIKIMVYTRPSRPAQRGVS